MFARVYRFENAPEDIDDVLRITREQILPLERRMEGFRGLLLLTAPDERRVVSVTLWETEELLRASDESAQTITRFTAASVGGKRRSVEQYEVALVELA
jgi:heme-degrading monooxygenase HmoA